MPIQRTHLLALALTACLDVPDVAEVGSEIGTTTTVTEPAPPTSPTPPSEPTYPPTPPVPPTEPAEFASEFCRKLKSASTDEKKVIAAALAAEAYDSDHAWTGAIEKDGLVRIQFDFAGTGLINHNFSAQLYADKNNSKVPGGCFALAVEGTQWGKGAPINKVNDVWSDMEASEIRRLGVLNDSVLDGGTQRQLPGGPASPIYVAAGFEQVSAHAAKLVDAMVKDYPDLLPTSGNIELDLVTGQSMGGAIAGVLAHSIEHFMLQVRLPSPPDATGARACPTETSPIARITNPSGAFLYQAPRAIAVVGNSELPPGPPIHHIYQPDDLVPQLPTREMRSVHVGGVMVPADPTAAPNLVLSRYTDWPDPLAIDWNTTGRLKNIILPIAMPGIANRWFAVPGFAFNVKIPLDYVDTSPCWEDPRARATELRDQSNCDGNLRVSRQFARPPKDLDQSSGFIKYAFAYAAGRVPDENLAPWLRPDNELNNRYPAQLVGGVPIAPDSLVGKSCKWGTYCNNPVGMFGMLRTLLAPALQLFANGFGAALTQNLYFWNPIGSATFAGELADGIYGTWRFHNPYTVSVAVGRLMNPELMAWVLDQIPTEDDHTPWSETLFCPWTESLLNLDCIDGAVAPAVPGPNGLVQARACAIAVQ